LLADAESVDIVLTHFHLDHVVDLSYLPALPLREPRQFWSPGRLLTGIATRSHPRKVAQSTAFLSAAQRDYPRPCARSPDATHTAAGDAARIARESPVEQLVLIHINPLQESDAALAEIAVKEFPDAEVGRDLAPIPLD
jgi:ribonuclease BN (tRNA processing enzyme)